MYDIMRLEFYLLRAPMVEDMPGQEEMLVSVSKVLEFIRSLNLSIGRMEVSIIGNLSVEGKLILELIR
jgi:hypothetical protein